MAKKISIPMKELETLVHKLKDEEFMSWGDIAQHVSKLGHVSKRTSEPLTASSVRHIYYYGRKGVDMSELKPVLTKAPSLEGEKLLLLRKVLTFNQPADIKLTIIKDILDEDTDSI